jgi:hypothetical protein
MLTFGPVATPPSWVWYPLRGITFNIAPPLPKPEGGLGYTVGPIQVPAATEIELFSLKCVSFFAQFAIDYDDGRNSDILTALVQTDSDVHGVLTHELSESSQDIQYAGSVDSNGIVHVSGICTAPATIRGSVVYVPY